MSLILQPRRHDYKSRQKNRNKKKYFKSSLTFGTSGCQLQQPLNITGKQIFRLNLFLKRSSKKAERTKRQFWLNLFPHLPLTRKVKGSRMGKGVGKLTAWFSRIPGGLFITEFKHLRPGRAKYFSSQLELKLSAKVNYFYTSSKPSYLGKKFNLRVYQQPLLLLN